MGEKPPARRAKQKRKEKLNRERRERRIH